MTIALLAEELLREILRYLLVPPYADFLRFPNNDAIPRWSADWTVDDWWDASLGVEERVERARPADVLLVCKTWLRIGTPLLYECVSVWAPRHTKAVAALLTREPQLGCAVRCLRLEGGMGKALATVVKHAAGFHTLYVSLHVKSSEGVVGLQKSAALMNPRALYIHGGPSTHNKWYYDAAMVIEDAIADQWKQSLSSISFSGYFRMTARLAKALSMAPSLTTMDIEIEEPFKYWIRRGYLLTICRNTSLRLIRYHGMDAQSEIEAKISRRPALFKGLAGRLTFVESAVEHSVNNFFALMDIENMRSYDPDL